MPRGATSFKDEWLKQVDSNGHILRSWCEKSSQYVAFCKFCKKPIKCDNRGLSQLADHAASQLHINSVKDIMEGKQLVIEKPSSGNAVLGSSKQGETLKCWSHADDARKAELLWCLKVVSSNFSFNSTRNVNELFAVMFPDSSIAKKFSVGPRKLSYLISEATGPYFHEKLVRDLMDSDSPFTMMYDELSNKQTMKQLDIKIRYWSSTDAEVNVHHLSTYLMGQATAQDISSNILKSIDDNKLPLRNLIMLGSDGPPVNIAVSRIITEAKKDLKLPGLANVGTCLLHVVHNAFGKGLINFGKETVDLIIDLYNFFKLSPVRVEHFKTVQDELMLSQLKFFKHVQSRWMTLAPAIERVLNQWKALVKYFVVELPKKDSKIAQNVRYSRILKCLKNAPYQMQVQMHFLLTVAKVFQPYQSLFQREEPLIHILYDQNVMLLKLLLGRFIKPEELQKCRDLASLKVGDVNIEVSNAEIEIGSDTRNLLTKLSEDAQKVVLSSMRIFYREVSSYLLKRLIGNDIIKDCRCLLPENRQEVWTINAIKSLADTIPLVPPVSSLSAADEWKILQCEDIDNSWYTEIDEEGMLARIRIDHYFAKVFLIKTTLGEEKYPELKRLIKGILVLSHGNSDVERAFSNVNNFLTESRTQLSSACISAIQSTKDGLKKYGYQCHKVPITSEFLGKARTAYKSYTERLEEEARLKAEIKKKKEEVKKRTEKEKEEEEARQKVFEQKSRKAQDYLRKEKDLNIRETGAKTDFDTYNMLLKEANERIKQAVKKNDMNEVKIGQTMLEAAQKKTDKARNNLDQIREEQKQIERNKRTMLDFFSKAPDTKKAKKK